jgi:hypothetical protein
LYFDNIIQQPFKSQISNLILCHVRQQSELRVHYNCHFFMFFINFWWNSFLLPSYITHASHEEFPDCNIRAEFRASLQFLRSSEPSSSFTLWSCLHIFKIKPQNSNSSQNIFTLKDVHWKMKTYLFKMFNQKYRKEQPWLLYLEWK